ncbi:hypothetical protein UFOVP142_26 [uncultured Caudovirales phage]|uniref:Uncharacterized protein n=1 Tax=uncultured Caudovirales phage TaxID=2100421 RepID=A0A6J7XNU9_9CAUD|nr:hypothetical protein UFOVP142_26 [uncultured Caudovirales phage]
MITAIVVRLLSPIIVEVIQELLSKLANGQSVEINETSVKQAMMARDGRIESQLKSVKWEAGL